MNALRDFLSAREIWEVPLAASIVAGALLVWTVPKTRMP